MRLVTRTEDQEGVRIYTACNPKNPGELCYNGLKKKRTRRCKLTFITNHKTVTRQTKINHLAMGESSFTT